MFTTTAGKLAAQRQTDIFEAPAAEDFTLAPSEEPAIARATKAGATFHQAGADWIAAAHRRGRCSVPLATFKAPTKAEAAAMFCNYFHLKV
jgi:hypothetical protein